jgi:hypothetical protein
MTAFSDVRTAAVRLPALPVPFHQGAGTHVAYFGQLGAQAVAPSAQLLDRIFSDRHGDLLF